MSHIFISHAQEDRTRAGEFASLLEAKGWTAWWDRRIPPGRTFDEVIEEALGAAQCVIVLWSSHSIASRWVRAEASAALEKGTFVPVLIEPVAPPLEFRRIQAADLSQWQGEEDDPELRHLLDTIGRLIGAAAAVPTVAAPRSRKTARVYRDAIAGLAGLVAGGSLVYLLMRELPAADGGNPRGAPTERGTDARTPDGAPARDPSRPPGRGAPVAASDRVNLIASVNGGKVVRAPNKRWEEVIDGKEDWEYVDLDEAVFAFKDDEPATFDTFQMLIPEAQNWGVKEFELLAGDDSRGPFESLGTYLTENVRLSPSPWQEFKFPPKRARYLKVRVISVHTPGSGNTPQAWEWRLLGTY